MRIAAFFILAVFSFLIRPVYASGNLLTVDLAEDSVQITTGFNGSRLSLFGVKDQAGDVAIVIQGPDVRMTVRRKGQSLGMWRNVESIRFRNVPSYYDFAMSAVEQDIAPAILREEYNIGLDTLNFDTLGRHNEAVARKFREALIRNKQVSGHFALEPQKIVFLNDNFFRADFDVPSDVPTGLYKITTYLFNDGRVIEQQNTQIRVGQVGFSASVYNFAHEYSVLYGITAILIALLAGWFAYLLFKRD